MLLERLDRHVRKDELTGRDWCGAGPVSPRAAIRGGNAGDSQDCNSLHSEVDMLLQVWYS